MADERRAALGPEPGQVKELTDLARELDRLRRRAARGTGKARVSLEDLAKRVGLPRSTVHAYVIGKALAPADTLDRIVIALGADPAEQCDWAEAWQRVGDQVADHRRAGRSCPRPPDVRWPAPRQLPPDVARFTGRAGQMQTLDQLLAVDPESTAVALAVIGGPAGVGKTALAVHWAHRVRYRYPDGQLYVNLRGYGPGPPQEPGQVLDQLLRDLAVPPDQVPAEIDARTALFRSMLADRQVLILLDDARDADQVRPLLPGGAACSVLVTSRSQLRGLRARDGATPVAVPPLGAADASRLLATMIGTATIAAEPDAAGQIVEYCDGLPLALGIVGERAARRSGLTLGVLVDELADARGRLDALDTGDGDSGADLRAVLSWSYRALPDPAARLFRRLSLHPGTDFDRCAAGCLAGLTEAAAAKVLDTLAGVHLIEDHGAGRYQLHDLLRIYAGECVAAQESDDEVAAGRSRLFHWHLHTTDAAIRVLRPEWTGLPLTGDDAFADGTPAPLRFATGALALAFLDVERANLAAVIRQAGESGPRPVAWLLTERLREYVMLRQHIRDLLPVTRTALAAAQVAEDRQAEVVCHLQLGVVLCSVGEGAEGIGHFRTARAVARTRGWPLLESDSCVGLGNAYTDLGRLDEGALHLRLALSGYRNLNLPAKEGKALGNLGVVYWAMGRLDQAAECFAGTLRLVRHTGDSVTAGRALANLGVVLALQGRVREALESLSQASETYRRVGDRAGQGAIHLTLADICAAAGRDDEAHEHATVAVALAREAGDILDEANGLNSLGAVLTNRHRPAEAAAAHAQALRIAEDAGERYPQCQAQLGLARARLAQEQLGRARAAADAALAIARGTGYRLLEGLALTAGASVRAAAGELDDAAVLARRALAVHRRTGHRHGEAGTLLVLGELLAERGDHPGSQAHRQRAEEILGSLRASQAPWPSGSWVDGVAQAPGQS